MATSFDTTLSSLGINRTSTSAATTNSSAATTLDQTDFLTLMTTQLKNQDPFNPVDNTAMIAQMAQMSSTAGISEMNTTLKAMADKLNGTSTSDALAYVGKTVLTEGSTAYERTAGGIAGAVELDAATTDTNVTITDKNGATVKTIALGAQKAGTVSYDWDGTNDAGTAVDSGPYTVTVAAANAGTTVTARRLVWAPVESVSLPSSGSPTLTVTGIGQVAVSAVRSAG